MTAKTEEFECVVFAKTVAFVGLVLSTFSLIYTIPTLNLIFKIIGIFFVFSYGILLWSLTYKKQNYFLVAQCCLIVNYVSRLFGCISIRFYSNHSRFTDISMTVIDVLALIITILSFFVNDIVYKRLAQKPLKSNATESTSTRNSLKIVYQDTVSKASAPMEEE